MDPSGIAEQDDGGYTVRPLGVDDRETAVTVINSAAEWYRDFLPPEEVPGPEMTPAEWDAEASRMTWYGIFAGTQLLGVMGLEYVREVALLRHAYVAPDHQRRGVGRLLHSHVEGLVAGVERIVVGTYAANHKARRALETSGYRLSADSETVLRAYYDIDEDRLVSSVTYEKRVGD